jgi:malate permease and related proteins
MLEITVRFIPIFLIIAVGALLRSRGILTEEVVSGLKKLIIYVGLPALLFLSFLSMEFTSRYLLLFAAVFLLCVVLFLAGLGLERTGFIKVRLSPFFYTGFEFGMVGVALFTALFGIENLPSILLLGLGHELFIWFFYVPLLEAENHGRISARRIGLSFITSPIIIAIFLSLAVNLTGLYALVKDSLPVIGLVSALDTAGRITTPLILLAIGFQLKLTSVNWGQAIKLISSRFIITAAGSLLLFFITDRWIMELDAMMVYAFVTFFLLPPPFVLPVFLGDTFKKESEFYNNLLVLYTVMTLIIFAVTMVVIGTS